MKKIIAFLLVIILCLTLAACGGGDENKDISQKQHGTNVVLAAGIFHTVGLKSDGTVLSTVITDETRDYGQCDVGDWNLN